MLRKLLAGLLILTLLCSALPVGVYATEEQNREPAEESVAPPEEHGEEEALSLPPEDVSPDLEDRTYGDYRLGEKEMVPVRAAEKASETEGICGASLQWTFLTDSGELIISGTGDMEDYASGGAPWNGLRGKITKLTVQDGVSYLGKYAFRGCTKLTEVSLPGSLKGIGHYCFQECELLTNLSFPEGLETIGYAAFHLADLKAIHIPSTMSLIGDLAFYGCENLNEISIAPGNETYSVVDGVLYNDVKAELKLCPANRTEHLVIPDTVERLLEEALAHCTKLEGVTIPDGMRWDLNAFVFCKGLMNVYTYDTNPKYQSIDGVLYSKDQKTLLLFPAGRSGSYTVKDGTVVIDYASFCRMEKEIDITLPDSVEVIDGSAFSYSPGLRNLKLSANLRELYAHVFNGCTNMNNVVLPETLTLFGYGSFENCKAITEITIPSQITSIATDTFRGCSSLKKVELKGDVTEIYSYAFYKCKALESINFPESLDRITYMAFYGCEKLQELDLPSHMTYLGSQAFSFCKAFTRVEIPQGIEELPSSIFDCCYALKEVVLPRGLKSIGSNAFYNTKIEQLVIPETVTELGNGVFRWCRQLHCIHFLGNAPTITDSSFEYTPDDLVLCYTEGAEGWSTPEWNGISTALWSYDYSSNVTCTQAGEERFQCKHCDLLVSRKVGAYGHSFGDWTLGQRPTQEQEGYWTRSCTVCAAQEQEIIPVLLPVAQDAFVSNNSGEQNYSTYGKTVKSYLVENADGTLTRIESAYGEVCVEKYNSDFELIESGRIPMELPIFGGFYEGETDYFLAFGQRNDREEDSQEVVRIVRYSKDWLRKGQSSLYGANTYIPFDAGSLRMTQYGDMLYVHTCHEMYKSSDGYHHQANMIFGVYLPQMNISDQYTEVMNVGYGYVSHSFNQFVLTDGNRLLTLNHGDAYPRSAVIVQYNKPAGEMEFTGQCQSTSVLAFYGNSGYNATGASLGAFELSSAAYLTAGNSILQDGSVSFGGQRNIFLGVTPRGEIGTASSTVRWITNYDNGVGITVSTPHLVKIDENRFLLLWTENQSLRYVFVDANGVKTSKIYEANLPLSDCKPIVYNGAVCWYVTQNSKPLFCSIPLEQPEKPVMSELELTVTLDPNGGTLENNTLTLVYGQPYGELPTPSRKSAYRFLGWFNGTYSSSTQVTGETLVTKFFDHTLYARWEKQDHSCKMEVTETIPATCTTGETKIYTCIYCDYSYKVYDYNYVHTWDAGTVTTQPTCVKTGVKTFTCVLCGAGKTESVPATGHSYTDEVTQPTCLERGYTTHRCACGHEYTDSYVAALGHSWDEGRITTAPGCEAKGVKTYSCVRCDATKTESVPATGHSYTDEVTQPTCLEGGYTTHRCTCGHEYTDSYVAALGHDWDEGRITIEPGCETEGERQVSCNRCQEYQTETVAALGHDWDEGRITIDPGCETEGERQVSCNRCQAHETEPVAALGHDWDNGTIIREPTEREEGLLLLTCQRCGQEEEQSIPMLEERPCDGGDDCPSKRFTDVAGPRDWTHAGIDFVVDRGLFNGTTSSTFEPDSEMTRAMLVTVLWRYAGSPEEGRNIFTDVPDSSWYTRAVAWAAHHGVVNGVGDGRFDPEGKITREQMATILYRYVSKIGIQTDERADLSAFPDASRISGYAVTAMEWAVAEGLISGSREGGSIYLQPEGNATRAQVAAILMRLIKNVLE